MSFRDKHICLHGGGVYTLDSENPVCDNPVQHLFMGHHSRGTLGKEREVCVHDGAGFRTKRAGDRHGASYPHVGMGEYVPDNGFSCDMYAVATPLLPAAAQSQVTQELP